MYTCRNICSGVNDVHLYYNGLPAGSRAACWIGRIEALEEHSLALASPALEAAGQKTVFPVPLKADEHLEMDFTGRCRHFDPNGGLLAEVKPQGSLRLEPGEDRVRFSCATGPATSPRAEISFSLRGKPLPSARR